MNTKVIYFLASLMASLLFNIPLVRARNIVEIGGDVHGNAKTYGSDNVVNIKGKLHGKRYDEENDGNSENDYSNSSHDVNVEGHGTNLQVDSVPGDLNIGGSGGTINVG